MSKSNEILELLDIIDKHTDELMPVIERSADKLIQIGPHISKVLEAVGVGVAKMFVAQYRHYRKEGFSEDEAINLITAYAAFMGKKR